MTETKKLPLWRAISGFAVLACLLLAALAIIPVYVANYQLTQYVRTLASDADSARTPDETFRTEIVERAHQLHLPVQPGDVTVKHNGGKVQLQIARYRTQVYHADLHFSGVSTR